MSDAVAGRNNASPREPVWGKGVGGEGGDSEKKINCSSDDCRGGARLGDDEKVALRRAQAEECVCLKASSVLKAMADRVFG